MIGQNALEKIFFGVTAIIWIPLLLVGGTICLPFAASIYVNQHLNSGKNLEIFNKNREEFYKAFLKKYLDKELKEAVLDVYLCDVFWYSEAIQQKIGDYMELYSQSITTQVNLLTTQWRTFEDTQQLFNPVLNNVKNVLNNFYYFHGLEMKIYEYHREKFDDFESDQANCISKGSFSMIYKAYCESRKEYVAIKMMQDDLSHCNALEIFTEEKAWK